MSIRVDMTDVKRRDTQRPYPEDVLWDWKDNGRAGEPNPARVASMAASFEEHGQIQQVKFSLTHDRKLRLSAGFYRLLGAWEVNKHRGPEERMRLEGTVKDGNPEELFLLNLAENRERNNTTVVDDAHNVRRLGGTVREVGCRSLRPLFKGRRGEANVPLLAGEHA
jgi:hypothetical protein